MGAENERLRASRDDSGDPEATAAAALGAARDCRHAETEWYAAWLDDLVADGTLARLAGSGTGGLLGAAVAVLDRLPAGDVPLDVLAEDAVGAAGALDATPVADLVLRALALRDGVPAPVTREDRRARWDAAGVFVDDVASQVLVLNLRAYEHALGSWLVDAAGFGIPLRITLQQLSRMPIEPMDREIHVCESRAVLRAAAERLADRSAALVCTEGVPSAACHRLLQAGHRVGARLLWRGDFDWPGLRATGAAIERYGALPWRMAAGDYAAGLAAGGGDAALVEPLAPSPWDPRLARRMYDEGRAVPEDALIDRLLEDLAR